MVKLVVIFTALFIVMQENATNRGYKYITSIFTDGSLKNSP